MNDYEQEEEDRISQERSRSQFRNKSKQGTVSGDVSAGRPDFTQYDFDSGLDTDGEVDLNDDDGVTFKNIGGRQYEVDVPLDARYDQEEEEFDRNVNSDIAYLKLTKSVPWGSISGGTNKIKNDAAGAQSIDAFLSKYELPTDEQVLADNSKQYQAGLQKLTNLSYLEYGQDVYKKARRSLKTNLDTLIKKTQNEQGKTAKYRDNDFIARIHDTVAAMKNYDQALSTARDSGFDNHLQFIGKQINNKKRQYYEVQGTGANPEQFQTWLFSQPITNGSRYTFKDFLKIAGSGQIDNEREIIGPQNNEGILNTFQNNANELVQNMGLLDQQAYEVNRKQTPPRSSLTYRKKTIGKSRKREKITTSIPFDMHAKPKPQRKAVIQQSPAETLIKRTQTVMSTHQKLSAAGARGGLEDIGVQLKNVKKNISRGYLDENTGVDLIDSFLQDAGVNHPGLASELINFMNGGGRGTAGGGANENQQVRRTIRKAQQNTATAIGGQQEEIKGDEQDIAQGLYMPRSSAVLGRQGADKGLRQQTGVTAGRRRDLAQTNPLMASGAQKKKTLNVVKLFDQRQPQTSFADRARSMIRQPPQASQQQPVIVQQPPPQVNIKVPDSSQQEIDLQYTQPSRYASMEPQPVPDVAPYFGGGGGGRRGGGGGFGGPDSFGTNGGGGAIAEPMEDVISRAEEDMQAMLEHFKASDRQLRTNLEEQRQQFEAQIAALNDASARTLRTRNDQSKIEQQNALQAQRDELTAQFQEDQRRYQQQVEESKAAQLELEQRLQQADQRAAAMAEERKQYESRSLATAAENQQVQQERRRRGIEEWGSDIATAAKQVEEQKLYLESIEAERRRMMAASGVQHGMVQFYDAQLTSARNVLTEAQSNIQKARNDMTNGGESLEYTEQRRATIANMNSKIRQSKEMLQNVKAYTDFITRPTVIIRDASRMSGEHIEQMNQMMRQMNETRGKIIRRITSGQQYDSEAKSNWEAYNKQLGMFAGHVAEMFGVGDPTNLIQSEALAEMKRDLMAQIRKDYAGMFDIDYQPEEFLDMDIATDLGTTSINGRKLNENEQRELVPANATIQSLRSDPRKATFYGTSMNKNFAKSLARLSGSMSTYGLAEHVVYNQNAATFENMIRSLYKDTDMQGFVENIFLDPNTGLLKDGGPTHTKMKDMTKTFIKGFTAEALKQHGSQVSRNVAQFYSMMNDPSKMLVAVTNKAQNNMDPILDQMQLVQPASRFMARRVLLNTLEFRADYDQIYETLKNAVDAGVRGGDGLSIEQVRQQQNMINKQSEELFKRAAESRGGEYQGLKQYNAQASASIFGYRDEAEQIAVNNGSRGGIYDVEMVASNETLSKRQKQGQLGTILQQSRQYIDQLENKRQEFMDIKEQVSSMSQPSAQKLLTQLMKSKAPLDAILSKTAKISAAIRQANLAGEPYDSKILLQMQSLMAATHHINTHMSREQNVDQDMKGKYATASTLLQNLYDQFIFTQNEAFNTMLKEQSDIANTAQASINSLQDPEQRQMAIKKIDAAVQSMEAIAEEAHDAMGVRNARAEPVPTTDMSAFLEKMMAGFGSLISRIGQGGGGSGGGGASGGGSSSSASAPGGGGGGGKSAGEQIAKGSVRQKMQSVLGGAGLNGKMRPSERVMQFLADENGGIPADVRKLLSEVFFDPERGTVMRRDSETGNVYQLTPQQQATVRRMIVDVLVYVFVNYYNLRSKEKIERFKNDVRKQMRGGPQGIPQGWQLLDKALARAAGANANDGQEAPGGYDVGGDGMEQD